MKHKINAKPRPTLPIVLHHILIKLKSLVFGKLVLYTDQDSLTDSIVRNIDNEEESVSLIISIVQKSVNNSLMKAFNQLRKKPFAIIAQVEEHEQLDSSIKIELITTKQIQPRLEISNEHRISDDFQQNDAHLVDCSFMNYHQSETSIPNLSKVFKSKIEQILQKVKRVNCSSRLQARTNYSTRLCTSNNLIAPDYEKSSNLSSMCTYNPRKTLKRRVILKKLQQLQASLQYVGYVGWGNE